MSRIIRVFPRRTSQTPTDDMAFIGDPTLIRPPADAVHVSCTFSWDVKESERLCRAWQSFYPKVRLGGFAISNQNNCSFVAGRYVKQGVVHTSRGCNFDCPWCLVPSHEGAFYELAHIEEGNAVQDNNVLLARKYHLQKVFDMLKKQRQVRFLGGLDTRILKGWHIEELRGLRIKDLWLAFDNLDREYSFKRACQKLVRAGFSRHQIRSYVLAGFNEPIRKAETRLVLAYECGALPFVQVYRDKEKRVLSPEDKAFVWKWSRPAAVKAMCRDG